MAWLSSRQSNPSKIIKQVDSRIGKSSVLTLGLSTVRNGEHDFTKNLWSEDDKNLRYFSASGNLSESSTYFLGSGLSPSLYLGFKQDSLGQGIGISSMQYHPFLELTENGSFLGAGYHSNKNSFNAFIYVF